MQINEDKIKEILTKENYLTDEDVKQAEEFSKRSNVSFLDYLLTEGLVTTDLLGQAIAEAYGIPYADLNTNEPSDEQIHKIPEEEAKKHRAVLYKENEEKVVVATNTPGAEGIKEAIEKIFTGKKVEFYYALPEDVDKIFIHYRKPLETRFSKIIESKKRIAPEIIDQIFLDALSFRTSDIHFEPQAEEVVIRFRVDGVLEEAGRLKHDLYENILNRIKVQSRLRIDEHFAAQDGSMRHEYKAPNGEDRYVDIRTSIVPTVEGEKIVLRLLASYIGGLALTDLGLKEEHRGLLEDVAKKPFGMILVTGPTGSGKTTTLYALLKILNHSDVNITTIEDPVEYKVTGVNQIQVNKETSLTFAKGLRSIVRQDPNIILVGEIRDEETAEIAVNAALTGHLLLSTFHANDAATAVPRLLDMHIAPFLLSSTLEVVVAQRLVRRICDHCRHSVEVGSLEDLKLPGGIVDKYFKDKELTFYKGKGCEICSNTGYKGRIGIFEFIRITPKMRELILKNPSSQEIYKLAREEGTTSLFEDGIEKVKSGVTTLEEVKRVAEPPESL
jgi:type II secretory ATPase GspE/PulE/Tfp pilus assembly ATPase PilB-like protein